VIADVSVPAEEFVLGRAIRRAPPVDLDIEPLIAHGDKGLAPYVRAIGDTEALDAFDRALRDDPAVTNVSVLERFADERFYRAHWRDGVGEFLSALEAAEASVLYASCADGQWKLRVLVADREQFTTFYERWSDAVDPALVRVFERSNPKTFGEFGLTAEQRDALVQAFELGYFAVPKEATIEEVADELGGSPQAVSQ
jgi:predicted DNA binding protein